MRAYETAVRGSQKKQNGVALSQLGNYIHSGYPEFLYGAKGCIGLKDMVRQLPQFELRFNQGRNATVIVLITEGTKI